MGFLGNVLSCIVAVTLFYHILEIEATKPCCDCTYNAPNVTSADLQKTYRDYVKQIWCRKEFMDTLSPIGLKFRKKILELVEDLGSPASQHAILMSYKFLTIAPFTTDKPGRCSMGKAINSTILYLKGDKKIIDDALSIYVIKMKEFNLLRGALKRIAAGCDGYSCDGSALYPTMPIETCYRGGFSYDIQYLWDRPEVCNSRIKELKQLVLEMYKSCNYSDNFIAMLATYPLLPSYRRIFAESNPNIIIEAMNLQMTSPIQQCCCYQRIKRIDELIAMYANEIDLQVANEKKRILCYKKCQ